MYEQIGSELKRKRQSFNLAQSKVAEKVGISRQWLNKIEKDEVPINDEIYQKIDDVLETMGIDLTYRPSLAVAYEDVKEPIDYEFVNDLKRTREEYQVTQLKLASLAGITREWLSKIEKGKEPCSEKLQNELLEKLEFLNPNNPRELIIDYCRVRFPTLDMTYVIENILLLKGRYFQFLGYGFYNYTSQYVMGDISLMTSDNEDMGILLELKGQGCRQFEGLLTANGCSWIDFFELCNKHNGVYKRIDLAINDKIGFLDIKLLTDKMDNGEYKSLFRDYSAVKSGTMTRHMEKTGMGRTLYIGSKKSEIYFCIYEKNYEQYVKHGIEIEDAVIINRFEIRLKNERAERAVHDLLMHNDFERTVYAIIDRYIVFLDEDEKKDIDEWQVNPMWDWFIGDIREGLRLTMKPEPYDIKRTENWVRTQVMPTLKMLEKIDVEQGTAIVEEMHKLTKLSRKHLNIVENVTRKPEEMIRRKE